MAWDAVKKGVLQNRFINKNPCQTPLHFYDYTVLKIFLVPRKEMPLKMTSENNKITEKLLYEKQHYWVSQIEKEILKKKDSKRVRVRENLKEIIN